MEASERDIHIGYEIARKFLTRQKILARPTGTAVQWADLDLLPLESLRPILAEFLWDDDRIFIEFPFVLVSSGAFSGSVIVSTSRDLPPIIRFTAQGDKFADGVKSDALSHLNGNVNAESLVLYLISPLEPMVRHYDNDTKRHVFWALPTRKFHAVPEGFALKRDPGRHWSESQVNKLWHALEETTAAQIDLETRKVFADVYPPPSFVVNQCRPTKYEQAYRDYSTVPPSMPISGCTPVGWAVLASAFNSLMPEVFFPDIPCWNRDWSSDYRTDPSRCPAITDLIWALHDFMGTTDDGGTYVPARGGECLNARFNLGWRWTEAPVVFAGLNFEIAGGIRPPHPLRGNPILFSADAQWNPGEVAGHSVTVYGYDADQNIYLCLGWGDSYNDCWHPLTWFSNPSMVCASDPPVGPTGGPGHPVP